MCLKDDSKYFLKGWSEYRKGNLVGAYSAFSSAGGALTQAELQTFLLDFLLDNTSVECIRAPYSSLAQLSYFDTSETGYIHAVFASNDYLLYPCERVILDMNFQQGEFSWIEKRSLLNAAQLNEDQFLDACLLAGFDYISTNALVLKFNGGRFSFQAAVDIVKQFGNGYNGIMSNYDANDPANEEQRVQFMRVKSIISSQPVLTDDGTVLPLSMMNTPGDLYDLVGPKYPDVVYRYLSKGVINPQVLNTLATSLLVESHPLCSGEMDEYRRFVTSSNLYNLRGYALAFLTQSLNQFWTEKQVYAYHWFDFERSHLLPTRNEISQNVELMSWDFVKYINVKKGECLGVVKILKMLEDPKFSKDTILKQEKGDKERSQQSIWLAALCQVLELRGFILKNHHTSPIGHALLKALMPTHNKNSPALATKEKESLADLVWLVLELFQTKYAFQLDPYNPSFDFAVQDFSGNQDATINKYVWFLSRLACLVPFESKGVAYDGPHLSKDLLGFVAFVKNLKRSLRNVVEMSLLSYLISASNIDTKLPPDVVLPFEGDTNTLGGLVMAFYLRECISTSPSAALQKTKAEFDKWLDVESGLKKVFDLWNVLEETLIELPHPPGFVEDISEYVTFGIMISGWVRKIKL